MNIVHVLICFFAVLSILLLFCMIKGIRFTLQKTLFCVGFSLYCTLVLLITLLGRDNFGEDSNYGPWTSVISLYKGNLYILYDSIFNVLMFIPMGVFIYHVSSFKCVVCIVLSSSLIIELLQVSTCRGVFEIMDLLANTLGGIIGYVIRKYFPKIISKISYYMHKRR